MKNNTDDQTIRKKLTTASELLFIYVSSGSYFFNSSLSVDYGVDNSVFTNPASIFIIAEIFDIKTVRISCLYLFDSIDKQCFILIW